MDVPSVYCVIVAVIFLAWEVRGFRTIPQWRDRRFKKGYKKFLTEEADLNNLLTAQCADGSQPAVPSLYGGMFLSSAEIDDLVRDTQEEMKPFSMASKKGKSKYVESNRFDKIIGMIQTFAAPAAGQQETCCETVLKVSAPMSVIEDGVSLTVVHMNHSYQYVQEGECVNPGATCRGIGTCTQRDKYAFLLLYDPALIGVVNPPVRYGRISVKSHCECMNIGRDMVGR